MTNNAQTPAWKPIIWIYVGGAVVWLLLWVPMNGYSQLVTIPLLWASFATCFVIFFLNSALLYVHEHLGNIETEVEYIAFVERNASYVVAGVFVTFLITNALIITRSIVGLKLDALPTEFYQFQLVALVFAIVGVLPLYWIPPDRQRWLHVLRHLKTVPLTFAICLFLGGIIILLEWLQ